MLLPRNVIRILFCSFYLHKQPPLSKTAKSSRIGKFFYVRVTQSSAKINESNIHEIETVDNGKTTKFEKRFDLGQQIEELIQLLRVNNSQLSDIEIMEKVLQGYQPAFFSSADLQMDLRTTPHPLSEFQIANLRLIQVFSVNFPSENKN